MMALLDLQTFAKAHNFKVVVANGFNQHHGGIKKYLHDHAGYIAEKFDWNCFLHDTTPYVAMIQKLVQLDGILKPEDWGAYHQFYYEREWPAKYLTNCQGAHPTVEGYKVVAEELARFIRLRGYV
jgi:hypothetical protein